MMQEQSSPPLPHPSPPKPPKLLPPQQQHSSRMIMINQQQLSSPRPPKNPPILFPPFIGCLAEVQFHNTFSGRKVCVICEEEKPEVFLCAILHPIKILTSKQVLI
jgi:hypothetical protein